MAANSESIVSSTVESGSGAFNFSLLQGATLTKIIVGAVVAVSVVAAVAVAGTVIAVRAQASPPATNPDSETTFKNIPITFDPTSNDIAIESENLVDHSLITLENVNDPVHGSIEWSATNKTVTYFPKQGWIGSEVFAYTIANDKRSTEGTINVTVVNRPPVAADDSYSVGRNNEKTLDILYNDEDPDKDVLRITDVPEETEYARITVEDNKLVYSTKDEVRGTDQFKYIISDGNDTASATVTVEVTNFPPVAEADHYSVLMNSGHNTFPVLVNDYDPNDDPLTITSVRSPDNGMFYDVDNDQYFSSFTSSLSTSNITYVPKWNSFESDAFDYTITDGYVAKSDEAFAVVHIDVINKPPTALNHSFEMPKTQASKEISLDSLISDENPFTCLQVTVPESRGTVELNVDEDPQTVSYMGEEREYNDCHWSLTYSPENGKSYTETFRYIVSDGDKSAVGFITVKTINEAPSASSKSVSKSHVNTPGCDVNEQLIEQLEFTVDFNDVLSDPDDDPVRVETINSFSIVTLQSLENNIATFRRVPCASGSETKEFYARDVQEDEENRKLATNTLTIELTNEPPSCNDRTIYVDKSNQEPQERDVCVLGDCPQLCMDPDNDELEVDNIISSTGWASGSIGSDKRYIKTSIPAGSYGNETITFEVSDGLEKAKGTINIVVLNQAPEAFDEAFSFSRIEGKQTKNMGNRMTDVNGDDTVIVGLGKTLGSISGDSVSFEYAQVTFTDSSISVNPTGKSPKTSQKYNLYYRISDQDPISPKYDEAEISIEIKSKAPFAKNYFTKYNQGSTVTIDLVALNLIGDEDGDTITLDNVGTDTDAGVDPQKISDFVIEYNPPAEWCDTSSFTYTISTADGQATGVITLETDNCECKKQLDVVFVVDRSGSVSGNWDKIIEFGRTITDALEIGPDAAAVGIVSFADDPSYDRWLSDEENDVPDFWDWMENNRDADGSTATGDGMEYARNMFSWYGRDDANGNPVERIYIVISDGEWNHGSSPYYWSGVITSDSVPSRIVTVGVGMDGSGEDEMEEIATNEDHFFSASGFDTLEEFTDKVINRACTAN